MKAEVSTTKRQRCSKKNKVEATRKRSSCDNQRQKCSPVPIFHQTFSPDCNGGSPSLGPPCSMAKISIRRSFATQQTNCLFAPQYLLWWAKSFQYAPVRKCCAICCTCESRLGVSYVLYISAKPCDFSIGCLILLQASASDQSCLCTRISSTASVDPC